MKTIFTLIFIFSTMQYNSQELQNIFGKDVKKLSISNDGKVTESQFPLSFFGKKVKDSNIRITENKMSSVRFSVDGKENLDLLEKILKTYQNPKMAIEASLFPNSNDETGTFGYGKASSKDFVFDKVKLGEYIYLIWDTEFFIIHFYKPKTNMNDSDDIRIELVTKK